MPIDRHLSEALSSHIKADTKRLHHNEKLFNIFEGDLRGYVEAELRKQLTGSALTNALHRIAPINVLKKICDKLSAVYAQEPTRSIEGDVQDSDSDLLSWYEDNFYVNRVMNNANEFYNLSKSALIQPFVHKGKPRLRAISPHQFTVYSTDVVDPTSPTHIMVFAGKGLSDRGEIADLWTVYTDDEIYMIDGDGMLASKAMAMAGLDGDNPFYKIPFVYVKKSENLLVPLIDTDTLAMTILIPILVTDVNFINLFSAFGVLYGVDVDDENIKWNPNSFLKFKSTGDGETKPEVGTIKLEGDIDKSLQLIQSELSFWLNTVGLKAGSVGTLSSESFASGISKLIDEADTTEARQKQITVFRPAESQLWDLVFTYMHPVWISQGMIENRTKSVPQGEITINYAEQIPLQTRSQVIADQRLEVESGFTTRKRAIRRLNPKLTDSEIDELIDEIDEERGFSEDQEPETEVIVEE